MRSRNRRGGPDPEGDHRVKLYRDSDGDYWLATEWLAVYVGSDIEEIRDNFNRVSLPFKRASIKYDLTEV